MYFGNRYVGTIESELGYDTLTSGLYEAWRDKCETLLRITGQLCNAISDAEDGKPPSDETLDFCHFVRWEYNEDWMNMAGTKPWEWPINYEAVNAELAKRRGERESETPEGEDLHR